jgi:hypothetical protein
MVIIYILLLVLFFLFLLDKRMEKFLSISMLKRAVPILCPNKVVETELVTLNKNILRDVDELMFSPKDGETIYDYTSV